MKAWRQRGFTLLEMVIAFAILGLTLVVLYAAFETTLARIGHDARLSEGTLLAQSLLARAGSEWPLDEQDHSGEWEGFSYVVAQRPTVPPPGQPAFTLPTVKVTVAVSWRETAGDRSVALSTLKFVPRRTT